MGDRFRKLYIALAIITGVVGLIFLGVISSALISLDKEKALSADAKDAMYRTAVLTNTESALPFWEREVQMGHFSVSDFVENQFTSHDYLLSEKSDADFAADLACVAYNDAFSTEKIDPLLENGSRRYAVEKILSDVDPAYAPLSGFSDKKGTSCGGVQILSPLQNEEGYAFGIRRIDGTMSVDGKEMRADFFVDRSLRPGEIHVPSVSGQVKFTMEWDTFGEIPGEHDIVILLRTSDGRGQVLTGGRVMIPAFTELENDSVVPSRIEAGTQESWYRLDARERNAYVNLLEASSDVSASIYDRYGNLIGMNDLLNVDYEVLRALRQDDEVLMPDEGSETAPNAFFVRIRRSGNSAPSVAEIDYTLVQSKEVALSEETGYMAVLSDVGPVPTPRPSASVTDEEKDTPVTCRNEAGKDVEFTKASLTFLPLNGYLTELAFTGQDGKDIAIYPEFDMKTFDYGIVGDSLSEVGIRFTSVEGYSAKVQISNSGAMVPNFDGEKVEVQDGENNLEVTVTSADGATRTYRLYLLKGQDSEGFRKNTLSQFPESYADGLWLLHSLHPKYQFEAFRTNMDFTEVLNNEDKGSRSLASSTYNPDWVKPGSPVYDGKSWKAARREVVAYFMDPRNFLTPTGVFQFEKLSFDERVHTLEGISAVTKNSFLDSDDPNYNEILLEAGKKANVSPYFLTSRIIQEMGRDGESKLAHGTLPGYEGYFNFYNIGSTPDPSVKDGALINGAKYAKYGSKPEEKKITKDEEALLLPWDSPEKAICGGAMWIAKSYIEIGQDTLYFQKFDLIDNKDGLYEHQYAQNISMASNESVRYYTAYASQDMLDSSFVFVIPVYESMPEEYGKAP